MSEPLPRQFGQYMLLKLLAKGGMGEIFLARTQGISSFEKYYAIKKLLKKFARDQDVGTRFIDEAKLGARLQHPNIVQVYDLGNMGEELYMATEFVDGFDLRRVLRFCHEKKKRIPLDIALFIVKEVLSGLSYAHRQLDADGKLINLIHRDISPQNVLVSFEGEVKIIDFGLAKSTQRSQETQANVLLGNFGYMSPEQARGQKLDVRTDIYSAGIVLFELVTRTKRFVDENPLRLLEMVARPTPVMPSDRAPDVPKAIDHIYARATSPNRDDRYEDADTFREEVMTGLHKLNPHASREHLAQFLNYLFLGGQAPAAPDPDALNNKSVAIQVSELYEQAESFRRTKEQDAQDRRLSQFADDAPQTGSHNLMRACRIGDGLSHAELTGEELPEEVQPRVPMPPSSAPLLEIGEGLQASVLPDEGVAPDIQSAPTNVYEYEAPDWQGQPSAQMQEPGPASELQAQLQAQLDVQAQLEAQLAASVDAPPEFTPPPESNLNQIPERAQRPSPPVAASPPASPPPPAEQQPTVEVALPTPDAFAAEGIVTLQQIADSDSGAELSLPPDEALDDAFAPSSHAPPASRIDPASRPPDPNVLAPRPAGGAVVTTVVGPRPTQDSSSGQEEPTVVVDMESIGGGVVMQQAMPAPDDNAVFSSGEAMSDSLIIDFDGSDEDRADALAAEDEDDEDYELDDGSGSGPAASAPRPGGARAAPEIGPDGNAIRPAAVPGGRRPKGRPVRDIAPRKRR